MILIYINNIILIIFTIDKNLIREYHILDESKIFLF